MGLDVAANVVSSEDIIQHVKAARCEATSTTPLGSTEDDSSNVAIRILRLKGLTVMQPFNPNSKSKIHCSCRFSKRGLRIIVDSRASTHITGRKDCLPELKRNE